MTFYGGVFYPVPVSPVAVSGGGGGGGGNGGGGGVVSPVVPFARRPDCMFWLRGGC
jgi:hypothetical protein